MYVIVIVTITVVQVLVIDGIEYNVIVIESKVIVIELLLCYYNRTFQSHQNSILLKIITPKNPLF